MLDRTLQSSIIEAVRRVRAYRGAGSLYVILAILLAMALAAPILLSFMALSPVIVEESTTASPSAQH